MVAKMMATRPEDRYPTPQAVMRPPLPYLRSRSGDSLYLPMRETGQEVVSQRSKANLLPSTCTAADRGRRFDDAGGGTACAGRGELVLR